MKMLAGRTKLCHVFAGNNVKTKPMSSRLHDLPKSLVDVRLLGTFLFLNGNGTCL
jgi:hypothetical protein